MKFAEFSVTKTKSCKTIRKKKDFTNENEILYGPNED